MQFATPYFSTEESIPLPAGFQEVAIIGAGATGFRVLRELVCAWAAGFASLIHIWDGDMIEPRNATQGWYAQHVRENIAKAVAATRTVKKLAAFVHVRSLSLPLGVHPVTCMLDHTTVGNLFDSSVIICCADSRTAREWCFAALNRELTRANSLRPLLIDPRCDPECIRVLWAHGDRPDTMERYASSLQDIDDSGTTCGGDAVPPHASTIAAGLVINIYRQYVMGKLQATPFDSLMTMNHQMIALS